MNETIDLCESDSECTSNPRRSFKRENEVEVITLDDSSCSATAVRENHFLRPQAGTSAKRPKLELGQENGNKNDDSDIEIVEVKDVQRQKKLTPKRKPKLPTASSAKRRKSKFQTPYVYRGISSNSRVSVDNLMTKVLTSAKKNKGKMKKRRKMQAKKLLNTSAVSPGRKAAAQKKKEAVKQQTRQVLQSQEYSQNKFPRKIARDRKAHVPLQNGKPKFRMEPFLPQPQLIPRDRILLEPKLLIPPRDPNAESTSRIFGTGLSEPLCKDVNKDDVQAALTSSSDTVVATSGTSQVPPASSAVPDSTNYECAQVVQPREISSSSTASSLPSASTFQSGWSLYGSNIYNSDAGQSKTKGSLRPIVIDGSNVAMAHGNNRNYSCRGIKVCSDYFRQRGHTVIAFVPRFRQKFALSLDTYILEELENEGVVKFTPSREVDGQRICSYDDRFIVQYAADSGGIIVSNDNFRDLFEEQPLWRDAIRNRVLPYTWVSPTCIMFPPDPLGASGPPLDEFLRF